MLSGTRARGHAGMQARGSAAVYSETVSMSPRQASGPDGGQSEDRAPVTLRTLRRMAADGKAWGLVTGAGEDLGAWIIETVTEDQSHIAGDGTPRRIDFTVTLKYAPDLERLGRLAASAP